MESVENSIEQLGYQENEYSYHSMNTSNLTVQKKLPKDYYTNTVQIPNELQPISMWGYFGYEILFAIPIIGLICLLVFSFGGTKNMNLKNFARSYFCFVIVIGILCIILVL